MVAFQRERRLAGPDFDLLAGSDSLYVPALDAGANGGVMALANVVPGLTAEIGDRFHSGDDDGARNLCASLVDLNQAITARYGVPGLKEAMRYRDVPAGHVCAPHEPLKGDAVDEIHSLVDGALQPERA